MGLDTELPATVVNPSSSQTTTSDLDLLSQLPVLVWTTDSELRLTKPAHFGAAPIADNALPQRPVAAMFRDNAQTVMDHHRRALAGTSTHFEFEQDGRSYLAHIAPQRNQIGRTTGVVGIAIDISQQRKQAQIKRHMRDLDLIGDVVGTMAHDFNNLLTIISSYTQFLLERIDKNDASYEDVQVIQDATKRGGVLVRDLLAFSRKQPLRAEPFDINEMIERIAKSQQQTLATNVKLVVETWNEPCIVRANIDSLEQALIALMTNATEATGGDGVVIWEVTVVELDHDLATNWLGIQPGRHVRVTISDTGQGMTGAVTARMFEPFFTTKVPRKGAGLGASAAHGVLKQCAAGIWVHSLPGFGTTFNIYLPLVEQRIDVQEAHADVSAPPKDGCILIIEGEDAYSGQALHTLRNHSYRVLAARDGIEAQQLFDTARDHIDLILCEGVLPDLDCAAFLRKVHETHPDLPFICMSGYTPRCLAALNALPSGTPVLSKPFSSKELVERINDSLSASKHRDSQPTP